MSRQKKPRCFIAMAFDHPDTDAIYKCIADVLKKNDVKPIIINRRQSNQDINIQIIEQIENCDFCITDLTYARPSVYFEAGFAQCKGEVIYTVRADHLEKNQEDNLRVHFDLQMKPLIKWKDPVDPTFCNRLEKRLKSTVLKKWRQECAKAQKKKHEILSFKSMSNEKKLESIRSKAINIIHKANFNKWIIKQNLQQWPSKGTYKNPACHASRAASFNAIQQHKNSLRLVTLIAAQNITKKEFEMTFLRNIIPNYLNTVKINNLAKIKEVYEHHIIFALSKVPHNRITSADHHLEWDSLKNRYYKKIQYTMPEDIPGISQIGFGPTWSHDSLPPMFNRHIYYYIISDIKTISQICEKTKEIVSLINN